MYKKKEKRKKKSFFPYPPNLRVRPIPPYTGRICQGTHKSPACRCGRVQRILNTWLCHLPFWAPGAQKKMTEQRTWPSHYCSEDQQIYKYFSTTSSDTVPCSAGGQLAFTLAHAEDACLTIPQTSSKPNIPSLLWPLQTGGPPGGGLLLTV